MIKCPTDTWPHGGLRMARKSHACDYVNHPESGKCNCAILPGDYYFDPGDCNPSEAGGYGAYRYCIGGCHPGCPTKEQVRATHTTATC